MKFDVKTFFLLSALTGLVSQLVYADDSDFVGKWMVDLASPSAPITGLLELEKQDSNWVGHLEGGPVDVAVNGKNITVVVDSRDISGFVFYRHLTGKLENGRITGTVAITEKEDSDENGITWTAVPAKKESTKALAPKPVDLSGLWQPVQGRDFRKYSMDLTPAAKEWHKDYQMHIDQPNVRCVSTGVAQLITWSYPFEILQGDERITILYEVDSEVRRIYLDDTQPPEFYPNSPMGFSKGRWEGSTLVINTTLLSQNVRDFLGEPVSENARIEERYKLSDDGKTLTADIYIHDPENYHKPPIRRRKWVRDPTVAIFPYECDPDSFFRQLHDEGRMDEYIQRSYRRF